MASGIPSDVRITIPLAELKAIMLFAANDPKVPREPCEGVAIFPDHGVFQATDGKSAIVRFACDDPNDFRIPEATPRLIPIGRLKAALPAGSKGDVVVEPDATGVTLAFGGGSARVEYHQHVTPPPVRNVLAQIDEKATPRIFVDANLFSRLDAVSKACGYGKAMRAPWSFAFAGELEPIVATRPHWLAIIMPGRP